MNTQPIRHMNNTTWGVVERAPPTELSPNGRSQHWRKRQRAKREWKMAGWEMGNRMRWYRERHGLADIYGKRVIVTYVFVFPQRRKRDIDNLVYMMKPFMDGMVASRLIKDDNHEYVQHGRHEILHHKDLDPHVEVFVKWIR